MKSFPFPSPSYGGVIYKENSKKVIRLLLRGCTNRPFFHISVQEKYMETVDPVVEQIGSYDPLPNAYNEKLVAINFKRLEHWIQEGATITAPVLRVLGLAGYFPIHPDTIGLAWLNRKRILQKLKELKTTVPDHDTNKSAKSPTPEGSSST